MVLISKRVSPAKTRNSYFRSKLNSTSYQEYNLSVLRSTLNLQNQLFYIDSATRDG